jgi:hypothetical protein
MRVSLGQRKISKDEPQSFAEITPQQIDNGMGGSAVRTLIITVFYQGGRSVTRPGGMVTLGNSGGECNGFVHALSLLGS